MIHSRIVGPEFDKKKLIAFKKLARCSADRIFVQPNIALELISGT